MLIRDRMLLELAERRYKYPAVRVTHARELLDYNETEFWRRLDWLIDQPEVEREYPAIVRRRRGSREARRAVRTGYGYAFGSRQSTNS